MLNLVSLVCAATSLMLVGLVLAHRASGGGLSDLLGGTAGSLTASAHASRNLTRITVTTAVLWGASVFTIALLTS